MIPIQLVTIVSSGGTPMQLCDQRGAPHSTTGYGALVFNVGAHLIDAIIDHPTILLDIIKVPGGDFFNPSIQFTLGDEKTPGFYSTGAGNINLVGTSGDESSRALLASFNHPGNLTIPQFVTAMGVLAAGDDSQTLAYTAWVNDAIAAAVGGIEPVSLTEGTGINLTPNVITGSGSIAINTGFLDGVINGALLGYLPLTGGTLTGPLTGTSATMSGPVNAQALVVNTATPVISLVDTTSGVSKYLVNSGGTFCIVNNAFSANLLTITDAGVATFSGPLVGTTGDFQGPPLGVPANSSVMPLRWGSTDVNNDDVEHVYLRRVDGGDWSSAVVKIRRVVDGFPFGHVFFDAGTVGLGVGVGVDKALTVDETGLTTLAGHLRGTTATFSGGKLLVSPPTDDNVNGLGVGYPGTNITVPQAGQGRMYMTGANAAHSPVLELRSGTIVYSAFSMYDPAGVQRFYADAAGNMTIAGQITGAFGTFSDTVSAGPTGQGRASLHGGGAANTGYLALTEPGGARRGYIGFGSAGLEVNYVNDLGGVHSFGGGLIVSGVTPAASSNNNEVPTTAWVKANGASIAVGTTPPASPIANQLWWNSDDSVGGGQMFIWYNDGSTTQWVPASPSVGSGGIAPGSIMDYAGDTAPAGWLLCQGQSVAVATYPALHAAILYKYGGSGANFNVPDLGGRVTAGKEVTATRLTTGGAGIDGATLGAAGGTQTHVLTIAQLAAHGHGIQHSNATVTATPQSGYGDGNNASIPNSYTAGSDQPHQNTQPTMIMNKIIKI